MEQQQSAPASIYSTPVMFMDKEAHFDKGLINKPFEYKGRACYATGFFTVSPAGEQYLQVHTNHTGKPQNCFIAKSRLQHKNKASIAFLAAA